METTPPTEARKEEGIPLWLGAVLLLASSAAIVSLGFIIGSRVLLPFLSAAPFYPVLVMRLRAGRRGQAVALALVWALALGATSTTLCAMAPGRAKEVVWRADSYWSEMEPWVRTGEGKETTPARFLPELGIQLGIFAGLSLLTGSLLSIVMGAALMNYMSFYAGSLVERASSPLLMALAAWHPWSVLRVIAFVILGVVLAEPLLSLLRRKRPAWRPMVPWLVAAAIGIALDILLKTFLAPHWPAILRSLM